MDGSQGIEAGGEPHDGGKGAVEEPVGGGGGTGEGAASQRNHSSLASVEGSSGSREEKAAGSSIRSHRARVEGRRGRSWWEWKAAEQRKMQSGDEGDDELTSLEGESLKRRNPLPKIRENLPEPEGGYGRGGSGGGGGAGVGGARGPSGGGGGGGSPGLRVKRDERAAEPPLLHQPRHQPLLLQQHHFLPQQQQPHTRRAAPGPPGSQCGVGSGAPRYTTSRAPPTPAQPTDQPKKVTITSFNQPKLTPIVPPHSGTPTPVAEKKSYPPPEKKPPPAADTRPPAPGKAPTPAHDTTLPASPEKKLPTCPEKNLPLSPESPSPSAPPKDLVYADAGERRALRGHPHKYPSRKQQEPLEKEQPKDLLKESVKETPAAARFQPRATSSPTRSKESKDKPCDPIQGKAREKSGEAVKDKPQVGAGDSEKESRKPGGASASTGWKALPGGGAKFGQAEDKKRPAERGKGSLVWVNLPGGGSKLEWMPTPDLVTIKSTPALPVRDADRSFHQPHKRNDSVAGAARGTDALGRGDRGGGGAEPASGERVTRAVSDVPRASDARVIPGVHESPRARPPATRVHGVLKQPSGSPSSHGSQPKNGVTSAPGATHKPEGRGTTDADEGTVLTVAGRSSGQVVRIRVRPEVHAYLTGLPTTYVAASISAATASGRRDSHQDSQSSSGSALTGGSEGGGEGSTGYHEHDYEEVVDEYTLLRRAVDDHDPEAMQLLAAAQAAFNPDLPAAARPPDPGQSRPPG